MPANEIKGAFTMNDVIYWIWLALKNGYGSSEALKLLRYFPGGAREIYEATAEELHAVHDCGEVFLNRLSDHDLTQAEDILEFCFSENIRVISCASDEYPVRLHDLYNKPLVLYARGRIEDLNERFCVSIVGTRDMSDYGKHMTFKLARQLLGYGAIIISGAAYGIDSSANNTAMFFETPTVAVLGSGVNVPYPSSNAPMLDWIAEHGMVVSEYPPNTPPNGRNFPVRNRIISGLCDALIVVEAGEKSGALITARYAADQHRRVYAVPGNVGSPGSAGTNNLIRDGAKLVARSEDVLEDFIEQFHLKQVEKIVSSDKYLRYEYNTRIPVSPENLPISPAAQKKPAPPPARERAVPNPQPQPKPKPEPPAARPAAPQQESRRTREWGAFTGTDDVKIVHTVKPLQRPPVVTEEAEEIAPAPLRMRITDDAPAKAPAIPSEEKAEKRSHVLSRLEPVCTKVFDAIPEGQSATTDQIVKTGIPAEDVMAALTMLELYSAVELMPGGMYRKLI